LDPEGEEEEEEEKEAQEESRSRSSGREEGEKDLRSRSLYNYLVGATSSSSSPETWRSQCTRMREQGGKGGVRAHWKEEEEEEEKGSDLDPEEED
jgi:hypothetical protein